MVRDTRIKEVLFEEAISATTTNSFDIKNVNGRIIDVFWKFNRTGSIALVTDQGEEFFRRNAPSGAGTQLAHPRYFGESTLGSVAGADQFEFSGRDRIVLNVTGVTSGTDALQVGVRYI